MWLVYGGWHGYQYVILQPWTSRPVNLAEAARQNTHRVLKPGARFEVQVRATIYAPPLTWLDVVPAGQRLKSAQRNERFRAF